MHKKLKTLLIIMPIFFSLLLPASAANSISPQKHPMAVQGRLDLTNWNWAENGVLPLNGEWEFYWHTLLAPVDFKTLDENEDKKLIVLPRAWNNYLINQEKLPGKGYATYRLQIAHSSREVLGLKTPRIFTAYKLWVNGEMIASAGRIGTTIEESVPQYLPQVHYFKPDSGHIEIIMQVANFHHRSGGVLESLHLGSASQISRIRDNNLGFELFLFGSLFIIGCYHLVLFIFRTKDRSALYFAIYSLLISARTLLVSEIFFIHLFPNFNWEVAHKIQTLAYYLGVPLVVMFLKTAFPQDVSRKINLFIQLWGIYFGFLILFTPARIFTHFNPLYQIFSIFVILYIIYLIILTCYKRREGSYFIGLGLFILILSALNDILFFSIILADSDDHFLRNFITRGNLTSLGLLIFVFSQSTVLAKKFSKSFYREELLTKQLQDVNAHLEERVYERTVALEASRERLREAYGAVSRSEKSLQALTQNISHDLRTPLTSIKGYVSAILDEIITEPQQQKKYLSKVKDQVNHLNQMVQELLDFSQLQSRQLKLQFSVLSVKSFLETLIEKYRFDLENNQEKIVFKVTPPPGWPDIADQWGHSFVKVDLERLERVLTNLLSNAIKYSTVGDKIELSFSFTENGHNLLFAVADTGIGIPPENQEKIFDRFYTVYPAPQINQKSTGLGLAIAKEIVEYHKGEIWVKSEPGQGSTFYFTLPIYKERTKLYLNEHSV